MHAQVISHLCVSDFEWDQIDRRCPIVVEKKKKKDAPSFFPCISSVLLPCLFSSSFKHPPKNSHCFVSIPTERTNTQKKKTKKIRQKFCGDQISSICVDDICWLEGYCRLNRVMCVCVCNLVFFLLRLFLLVSPLFSFCAL
jgi:hypothetical protein